MPRPSFQFYPGDWLRNANLRRCTAAERGTWVDVMCLMHDSEEYGVLRWPLRDIAEAAGCKVDVLLSLARKSVMKGADEGPIAPFTYQARHARKLGPEVVLLAPSHGPLWYSSRMVRDEHVRLSRGITNDDTEDSTKGGVRCSTKARTNERTPPALMQQKQKQPMQGEEVTTLSGKGEGGW